MKTQIPKNWQKVKLGDIVNVYGGGTPSTKQKSYWGGDIPWLTPAELTNYPSRSIVGTACTITEEGLQNSSAKLMPKDSILLTSRATIGNATINSVPMATNQGFINIEPKKVDKDFFYYWLKDKRKYLNQIAIGSTFPELSKSVFKEIETKLPNEIKDQQKIAEILSAFDDKIEVNNKIAKTLEQMSQAIFKEWFVKEIKDGEKKSLIDIASYVNGGAFGKIVNKKKHGLPLIKIAELNRGITENTEWIDKKINEKYYINNGNLLFSWSGTVDIFIWDSGEAVLNQHIFKVLPKNGFNIGFIYFLLKNKIKIFKYLAGAKATTMGHIKKENLIKEKVIIPRNANIDIFEDVYRKIVLSKIENKKLAAMRDLLLPKLMRGEIRV